MELKKLIEQREAKQNEMKEFLKKATTEERALSSEEKEAFDTLEADIRSIDETIKAMKAMRDLEDAPTEDEDPAPADGEERALETREVEAFEAYIRNNVESRTAVNLTKGDNGAVVPTSIANKIISKVVDICPIYKDAERFNVKGTLQIPYYDETSGAITMAYADEFSDGESNSGKFTNISLTGFLGRAVTDVSKSLINNSDFNIVDFVVEKMAIAIAKFLEKELLKGTSGKIAGLTGVTQSITSASATAITADELIDLQETIPDVYQANAYWVMKKSTRTALRKLKDGDGNYLLNKDFGSRWGYTLLGKDVYCSDAMDAIGSAKTPIYYGDMKGLAVKVSEDINIEVLRETKARQHAVEVLGFVEADAKVQNAEMISKLVNATA